MKHHFIYALGGLGVIEFKVAVVCRPFEGLTILSIYWCPFLFGLCIYLFGCELIVIVPMPFISCKFQFIS